MIKTEVRYEGHQRSEKRTRTEVDEKLVTETLHAPLLARAVSRDYSFIDCPEILGYDLHKADLAICRRLVRRVSSQLENLAWTKGYTLQMLSARKHAGHIFLRYVPASSEEIDVSPEKPEDIEVFNLPENVEKNLLEKNIHLLLLLKTKDSGNVPTSFAELLEKVLGRKYEEKDLKYLTLIRTYLEVYGFNYGFELSITNPGSDAVERSVPMLQYIPLVGRTLSTNKIDYTQIAPQLRRLPVLTSTEPVPVKAKKAPVKREPVEIVVEPEEKEVSRLMKVMQEAASQIAEIFFAARLKVASLKIESVNQALKESKSKERVNKDLFLSHGIGSYERMTYMMSPREIAVALFAARNGFKLDKAFCEEFQAFIKTQPPETEVKDLELTPTRYLGKRNKELKRP